MHLLQVRGDSNRGRARGVTRIGERKVTQYSDVTQSVFHAGYLFCFLYLQISPFPCFNEYQKFVNDFTFNSSLLSFGLIKKGQYVTGVPEFLQGGCSICVRVWTSHHAIL